MKSKPIFQGKVALNMGWVTSKPYQRKHAALNWLNYYTKHGAPGFVVKYENWDMWLAAEKPELVESHQATKE